jgi:hypothetical protein
MAVCTSLQVLVASNCLTNTITVYSLPKEGGYGDTLTVTLLYSLGGAGAAPPMRFKFITDEDIGGQLAVMEPWTEGGRPLLFVTEAEGDAVHVIDVESGTHVGYVGEAVGSIATVAAAKGLVALARWEAPTIVLFQGAGATWTPLQALDNMPRGPGCGHSFVLGNPVALRFTADGAGIVVVDRFTALITMFAVADGSVVKRLAVDVPCARDIIAWKDGWAAALHEKGSVEFISGGSDTPWTTLCRAYYMHPHRLAAVPGVAVFVRDVTDGISAFVDRDVLAMTRMSAARVAWMSTAYRAVRIRKHSAQT